MKAWVYRLNKEQLKEMAQNLQIDDSGSLKELRKKINRYLEDHPEEFEAQMEESSRQQAPVQLTITTPGNAGFRTPTATVHPPSVRKYTGRTGKR